MGRADVEIPGACPRRSAGGEMEIDEKNIFFKPVNIKNMFSLQHKHAAITGAGSGIGKAGALLLARQGATVPEIDGNDTQSADVGKKAKAAGGNVLPQMSYNMTHN